MKRFIALPALAALAACASLEPEPCSAEWVRWKTDQTLQPFAREHRGMIDALRDFSTGLEEPGPLTIMRIAARMEDFRRLAEDFQSDVMPELEAAVRQCGTSAEFVPAFADFLREEGVEEEMVGWIELIGEFAASQAES